MPQTNSRPLDVAFARVCANCPLCRSARQRQAGWAFELVRRVESKACPFCRAYERVYGRKAHESGPGSEAPRSTTPGR